MSKSSKILVLATSRHTHGGITSVVKSLEKTDVWSEYGCVWIPTHRSGSKVVKYLYAVVALVRFMVLLPACDVVHAHIGEAPSARRKNVFLKLARIFNKKIVVHLHAFSMESTVDGDYGWLYKKLFNYADNVIVLSDYWKNAIAPVVTRKDRIHVLNNPCPKVGKGNLRSRENVILSAGVLSPRKGYADLIKAFAKISYKHPGWKLVFAGSGEIDRAKALAIQSGVGDKVEFPGWVSGDDKEAVFWKTSIFCLPSYAEGFPMAVLDAWAYGLPVVATPVGSLPEVAEDNRDLIFFNPGDVDALSRHLDRLIDDPCLRDRLSAASYKMADERFSSENIGFKLSEIYGSIIEN